MRRSVLLVLVVAVAAIIFVPVAVAQDDNSGPDDRGADSYRTVTSVKVGTVCVDDPSNCRKSERPIKIVRKARLLLRLDAALYEPAPPRRPRQIGRPRLKGERLPNLSVVAQDPNTVWKPTKIANWYGSGERMVEIASETAVWYSTGLIAVPVRWVLIRDPEGGFKTQALLCTDLKADPEEILRWFMMRWQLEVTFR